MRSLAGDSGLHNDSSSRDNGMEGDDKAGQKQQIASAPAAEPFEDSATPTVATYDCPVCRKAHVLDLDRLQVLSQRLLTSFLSPIGKAAAVPQAVLPVPTPMTCEAGGTARGRCDRADGARRWTPIWTAS